MKTTQLLIAVLCILATTTEAKSLKGKVINEQNKGIDFVTIVLQNADSTFHSSTFSNENGEFEFASFPEKGILIAQHIQYKALFRVLDNEGWANLIMKSKAVNLDEIMIKGERPLVRTEGNKLVYDANQLTSGTAVSSAYQVLTNLPGVIEINSELTLAGANNLNILINGKATSMNQEQLMELLKSMPKEQIKKMEVMYNTPPEYHVKGASINLVLAGTTAKGQELIQGLTSVEYEQKFYDNYKTTGNFRYANNKLAVDLLYSFKANQTHLTNDIFAQHTVDGTNHSIAQESTQHTKSKTHQVRIATDYDFNEQNKLNMTYTLEDTPWRDSKSNSIGTFAETNINKAIVTPSLLNNFSLSLSTIFNITITADYTTYRTKQMQTNEDVKTAAIELQSLLKQNIDQLNLSVDQWQEIKDWKISYGAALEYSEAKALQDYILSPESIYPDAYNRQREYSYVAYAGFEKKISDKLFINVYLNAEYYKRADMKKWNMYPIINLNYTPSASHIIQLGLESGKVYPSFWEMANTVSHMDDYIEIHGNPHLVPAKDYYTSLTYIFKNKYIARISYDYADDYFVQLPYMPANRLSLIYQTQNWNYRQKLSMNVTIPFSISDVARSNLTLVAEYQKAKSDQFNDVPFTNSRFVPYFILNNVFKLPFCPSLSFELNTIALGKSTQGYMDINSLWKMDIGFNWSFANEKASLKVKVTDMWRTWKPDVSLNHYGQTLRMDNYDDTRNVSIAFTYKFGGYKEKKQKGVDTSRFGNL